MRADLRWAQVSTKKRQIPANSGELAAMVCAGQFGAAAVDRLRREEGIGVSEAVNRIARAGLVMKPERKLFRQRAAKMGPFEIDVSNVAEALEVVEGPSHR